MTRPDCRRYATNARRELARSCLVAWAALLAGGCPGKTPSRAPAGKGGADRAEVEFSGFVASPVKATRFIVFFTLEPCRVDAAEVAPFGRAKVAGTGPFNFFDEEIVAQGTVAHICAAGLDEKGMLVAFGAYEQNPVTLRGQGEVEVRVPKLALAPVIPPRAAPKGL